MKVPVARAASAADSVIGQPQATAPGPRGSGKTPTTASDHGWWLPNRPQASESSTDRLTWCTTTAGNAS
jgi:hypothetical protein